MTFFKLCKDYLILQLVEKGKQFERSAKSDKGAEDNLSMKAAASSSKSKADHHKASEVDQNS